jgi:hypothetical protein
MSSGQPHDSALGKLQSCVVRVHLCKGMPAWAAGLVCFLIKLPDNNLLKQAGCPCAGCTPMAPQVLKFEAAAQPGALGGSVFGHNDAYCRLQPFIRKWRAAAAAAAGAAGPSGRPAQPAPACSIMPWVVSVEVTRAFDHVDIGLLLGLVEPLLRHQAYLVVKYNEASILWG